MTDRLDIYARTPSLYLPQDEEEQRLIRQLVYTTNKDSDTPFERLADFWFAAVGWAAHHRLVLPDGTSSGKMFVKLGFGSAEIQLADWQMTILQVLYLHEQDALHKDPLTVNDLDTSGGNFTNARPTGGSDVISVANSYALAGAVPLRRALTASSGNSLNVVRQLKAARNFKGIYETAEKSFSSAFIKPAGS